MSAAIEEFHHLIPHAQERLFLFRLIAFQITRECPDSCIVGGMPRDLMIRDAYAQMFHQSFSAQYYQDINVDPDSYIGRNTIAKDIDVLCPPGTFTELKRKIEEVLQQYNMRLSSVKSLTNYIPGLTESVHEVYRMKTEFHTGSFLKTTRCFAFSIDVIISDRLRFLEAIPFESDVYCMQAKMNVFTNNYGKMPLFAAFDIYKQQEQIFACPQDLIARCTHLRSTRALSNVQQMCLFRKAIHKTRHGWNVDGFDLRMAAKNMLHDNFTVVNYRHIHDVTKMYGMLEADPSLIRIEAGNLIISDECLTVVANAQTVSESDTISHSGSEFEVEVNDDVEPETPETDWVLLGAISRANCPSAAALPSLQMRH